MLGPGACSSTPSVTADVNRLHPDRKPPTLSFATRAAPTVNYSKSERCMPRRGELFVERFVHALAPRMNRTMKNAIVVQIIKIKVLISMCIGRF